MTAGVHATAGVKNLRLDQFLHFEIGMRETPHLMLKSLHARARPDVSYNEPT